MGNDLISRSALIATIRPDADEDTKAAVLLSDVKALFRNAISNAPAVDAVEVVRCKDCKHYWLPQGFCVHGRHDCQTLAVWQNDCDFCSYGERRTDDGK